MSLAGTLKKWSKTSSPTWTGGATPNAASNYRYDLLLFVSWVEEQTDLRVAGELTTALLEKYQLHLMLRRSLKQRFNHPRPMTAGSRNRHLAELRSFFRYLKKTCKLLSNPSLELERARESRRLPKAILSVPEVARLLQIIPKQNPTGLRDWAALELLYGTGIRRTELLNLELSDLRLSEELIHILGKGDKERIVPIGKAAQRAVERYLREGRPQLLQGKHNRLWVSSFHGGPVSDRELMVALRAHARNAGLKKAISYHLFPAYGRHPSPAWGADLRSIQILLGHAQLNTTAIYTRVTSPDLRKDATTLPSS